MKNKNPLRDLNDTELISLFINLKCSAEGVDKFFGICKNSTAREFNRRGISRSDITSKQKAKEIEEYSKCPKLCEHCGKPLPWEKRSGRFCSKSCAASENNMGKVKNPKGIGHPEKKPKEKNANKKQKVQKLPKAKICSICGSENCSHEFCRKHNLQQLNGLVKYLGFDKTAIGTDRVFDEFKRIRDMVYNLYWNLGYSRVDLGKKFGYPGGTMPMNVLKRTLEIPSRTQSEAVSNAILLNKTSLPKIDQTTGFIKCTTEHHITWTGKEVYLRSSYEIDYANFLDKNKILYSVEELRLEYYDSQQNRIRIAVPDFYLPLTNELVEIKSDFTLNIQEMTDKFNEYRKQGYVPKLILEKEEIDLENLQNLISKERYDKILKRSISNFRNDNKHIIDNI